MGSLESFIYLHPENNLNLGKNRITVMKYTEKGTLILDGKFVAKEMQNLLKNRLMNLE